MWAIEYKGVKPLEHAINIVERVLANRKINQFK